MSGCRSYLEQRDESYIGNSHRNERYTKGPFTSPFVVGAHGTDYECQVECVMWLSKREDLTIEYRVADQWISLDTNSIPLSEIKEGTERIDIRVKDEKGNARVVRWSVQRKAITSSNTTQAPLGEATGPVGMFGCSVSKAPTQIPIGTILLLLFLFPFIYRRRS